MPSRESTTASRFPSGSSPSPPASPSSLSAPAAMFAVRSRAQLDGRGTSTAGFGALQAWADRRRRSPSLFSMAWSGASSGPEDFFENPATIVVWVDFWVGLGDRLGARRERLGLRQPALNAAGRLLERLLAAPRRVRARYPERLGLWPATVFLLLWSVDGARLGPGARSRGRSRSSSSATSALQLARHGGLRHRGLAGPRGALHRRGAHALRASRRSSSTCTPGGDCRAVAASTRSASAVPSCWLDAAPDDRARPASHCSASGVRREAPLGTGGGTFVLALLATVVYDGFSQTQKYVDLPELVRRPLDLARRPRHGPRHAPDGR